MMFSIKKVGAAVAFVASTALGASVANAAVFSLTDLIANHGGGGVFTTNDQGLISNGVDFGAIVYDGSANANGQTLDSSAINTIFNGDGTRIAGAAAGDFVNGFHFTNNTTHGNFQFDIQINNTFPAGGDPNTLSKPNSEGFSFMQIDFFDATTLLGSGDNVLTAADLTALASAQSASLAWTAEDGDQIRNPAEFFGEVPVLLSGFNPGAQIVAFISGTAFNVGGTGVGGAPNYNVDVSAVPLPASVLMLVGALAGLGFVGRMKKSRFAAA